MHASTRQTCLRLGVAVGLIAALTAAAVLFTRYADLSDLAPRIELEPQIQVEPRIEIHPRVAAPGLDRLELSIEGSRAVCGTPAHQRRGCQPRWALTRLGASQQISVPGLTDVEVAACWQRALARISSVCGLELYVVSPGSPEARIVADSGPTGGGVLAWSYLPGCQDTGSTIPQRYSTNRVWTSEHLYAVMLHELMHAVGSVHSTHTATIMWPSFRGTVLDLQPADVRWLQAIYGLPGRTEHAPEPPAPGVRPRRRR